MADTDVDAPMEDAVAPMDDVDEPVSSLGMHV